MDDFQSFLDKNLSQIDIAAYENDDEIYEYNIYKEISVLVVRAREEAKMTQKELAGKCALTQANISNIEKGVSHPTIESLKKIADALGKRLVVEFADREEML